MHDPSLCAPIPTELHAQQELFCFKGKRDKDIGVPCAWQAHKCKSCCWAAASPYPDPPFLACLDVLTFFLCDFLVTPTFHLTLIPLSLRVWMFLLSSFCDIPCNPPPFVIFLVTPQTHWKERQPPPPPKKKKQRKIAKAKSKKIQKSKEREGACQNCRIAIAAESQSLQNRNRSNVNPEGPKIENFKLFLHRVRD